MFEPIKFYFDFLSPYAYFASFKIDETSKALDREVIWKPFLLGVLFQTTGSQPANAPPVKGDYIEHDWQRMGRFLNVPWTRPDPFPIGTQAVARTFYWLNDQDPALAKKFAEADMGRYKFTRHALVGSAIVDFNCHNLGRAVMIDEDEKLAVGRGIIDYGTGDYAPAILWKWFVLRMIKKNAGSEDMEIVVKIDWNR